MCYTQAFRICCWVEKSVVAEPCVASRRAAARGRNEEAERLPSVDRVQPSFGHQTGGEKESQSSRNTIRGLSY